MSDNTKDVEINGHRFRIRPVSARDGSWIMNIIAARKVLEPQNFTRVQDLLFARCVHLREADGQVMEQPLYSAKDGGRWLVQGLGLENDSDTVSLLMESALEFLLDPTSQRLAKEEAARQLAATTTP